MPTLGYNGWGLGLVGDRTVVFRGFVRKLVGQPSGEIEAGDKTTDSETVLDLQGGLG